MSTLVASLGWALAVASTITVIPQLVSLLRGRRNGVEPLTPAIASATMVSWVIFTASIKDLPALASSVGPLLIWSMVLAILAFHGAPKSLRAVILTVTISTLLIIFKIFNLIPISVFGVMAAVGSTLWALPQLIKVLRLKGQDISGVSFLAYLFFALENAAWILYAIGTGVIEYSLAPLIQFPACLAIAIYAYKAKKRVK